MTDAEPFWEFVCGLLPYWRPLVLVDVVILALLLVSLPFLSPDSGAFVVWVLAFVVVVVSLGVYAVVRRRCADR